MRHKVLKGKSRNHGDLDSTHDSLKAANQRAATLRKSYRGKKMEVWVEPCTDEDPINYRKPIRGPYTNYDGPRRDNVIKKGYARAKK